MHVKFIAEVPVGLNLNRLEENLTKKRAESLGDDFLFKCIQAKLERKLKANFKFLKGALYNPCREYLWNKQERCGPLKFTGTPLQSKERKKLATSLKYSVSFISAPISITLRQELSFNAERSRVYSKKVIFIHNCTLKKFKLKISSPPMKHPYLINSILNVCMLSSNCADKVCIVVLFREPTSRSSNGKWRATRSPLLSRHSDRRVAQSGLPTALLHMAAPMQMCP